MIEGEFNITVSIQTCILYVYLVVQSVYFCLCCMYFDRTLGFYCTSVTISISNETVLLTSNHIKVFAHYSLSTV